MVPKSVTSSLSKENGPAVDDAKISGSKRTQSECMARYPATNANGHLVYVRRKQETDFVKSSSIDNTINSAGSTQSRKPEPKDERIQQQSLSKDFSNPPEAVPAPRAPSESLSSTQTSFSLALGKASFASTPAESNLHVTPAISSLDNSKKSRVQQREERYGQLQNLLRVLDQSNREDYLQMLRSLSSVDLSRVAVELEKRAIQLSPEEAKEVQRVRLNDVLGKYPRNSGANLTQQDQPEK